MSLRDKDRESSRVLSPDWRIEQLSLHSNISHCATRILPHDSTHPDAHIIRFHSSQSARSTPRRFSFPKTSNRDGWRATRIQDNGRGRTYHVCSSRSHKLHVEDMPPECPRVVRHTGQTHYRPACFGQHGNATHWLAAIALMPWTCRTLANPKSILHFPPAPEFSHNEYNDQQYDAPRHDISQTGNHGSKCVG